MSLTVQPSTKVVGLNNISVIASVKTASFSLEKMSTHEIEKTLLGLRNLDSKQRTQFVREFNDLHMSVDRRLRELESDIHTLSDKVRQGDSAAIHQDKLLQKEKNDLKLKWNFINKLEENVIKNGDLRVLFGEVCKEIVLEEYAIKKSERPKIELALSIKKSEVSKGNEITKGYRKETHQVNLEYGNKNKIASDDVKKSVNDLTLEYRKKVLDVYTELPEVLEDANFRLCPFTMKLGINQLDSGLKKELIGFIEDGKKLSTDIAKQYSLQRRDYLTVFSNTSDVVGGNSNGTGRVTLEEFLDRTREDNARMRVLHLSNANAMKQVKEINGNENEFLTNDILEIKSIKPRDDGKEHFWNKINFMKTKQNASVNVNSKLGKKVTSQDRKVNKFSFSLSRIPNPFTRQNFDSALSKLDSVLQTVWKKTGMQSAWHAAKSFFKPAPNFNARTIELMKRDSGSYQELSHSRSNSSSSSNSIN